MKAQSKTKLKRNKLFNIYATQLKTLADLGVITSKHADEYHLLCPLCLNLFDRSSLNQHSSNPLTLEDAPPKSLGGQANTLTCKICNNQFGTLYDSVLFNRLKIQHAYKMRTGQKVWIEIPIGNEKVRGSLKVNKSGQAELEVESHNNNPKSIETFNNTIANGNRLHSMKIARTDPGTDSSAYLALLKSAYIQVFETIGYVGILSPALRTIREQIISRKDSQDNRAIILAGEPFTTLGNSVFFAKGPSKLEQYIVVGVNLEYEDLCRPHAVFIPILKGTSETLRLSVKKSEHLTFASLVQQDFFKDVQTIMHWSKLLSLRVS